MACEAWASFGMNVAKNSAMHGFSLDMAEELERRVFVSLLVMVAGYN